MKIAITGSRDVKEIISEVRRAGIKADNEKPDFVIAYGGDGSILWAEDRYPSVPKITIKGSETANKCMYEKKDIRTILERLKSGKYKILEEIKLEAVFDGNRLCALNEFQIRNSSFVRALRFSVSVDGSPVFGRVVGDGVIIATPFGASGYYYSAGGEKFKQGIGIALNNPHDYKGSRSIVASDSSEITVRVLREDGILLFDNCEKIFRLKPEDTVVIRRAKENAKFIALA